MSVKMLRPLEEVSVDMVYRLANGIISNYEDGFDFDKEGHMEDYRVVMSCCRLLRQFGDPRGSTLGNRLLVPINFPSEKGELLRLVK